MAGIARPLLVTGLVALVCATVVTTAHVLLRPRIEANAAAQRQARMSAMLERIPGLAPLLETSDVATLEAVLVDLTTGSVTDGDPLAFDPAAAAGDPQRSRALAPEVDGAGLGRVANTGVAYVVRGARGRLELVVLPFVGRGYQGPIRGLVALEPNLETIAALEIIEQAETPGLGARIQSPEWEALWAGRKLVDESGALAVTVVRGKARAPHEVDGLTGATRSSQGTGNAVRFWLGPHGYGPFLDRLREARGRT